MRVRLMVAAVVVAGLAAAGCSSSNGTPTGASSSSGGVASPQPVRTLPPITTALPVSHPTVWMCRPGMADNPCEGGLDATSVTATGAATKQTFTPAKNAPVDCFYVYPTASTSKTALAPLKVEQSTLRTTRSQAARFAQDCNLYVPIYRQLTLTTIIAPGSVGGADLTLGTQDVLSAWNDYLAHYNKGRGVVLIGHSQGAAQLINLMRTQIDKNPAERARLVSALVLGGNVQVPVGKDVGGDFQNIPACTDRDQTGCVIAYSTFATTPPANSLFGRTGGNLRRLSGSTGGSAGMQVLCTNPAALGGGSGALQAYLPTRTLGGSALPGTAADLLPDYPTGFVTYPGYVSGACKYTDGASFLQVTYTPAANDTRKVPANPLPPQWGLHLVDVNIALGNLVDVVAAQSAAWNG